MTVQDLNLQLFWILRVSTLRFGGSPLLFITFYSNQSGRCVLEKVPLVLFKSTLYIFQGLAGSQGFLQIPGVDLVNHFR